MKPILQISLILMMTALTTSHSRADAAKDLHAFFAAEWDWTMEQSPTWASMLGDRRWNDRWPDVSLAAVEKRHLHAKEALEKLRAIDRAALTPADQLSYDLFVDRLSRDIAEHPFGWHLVPLNQRGGIQTEYELADSLRFETAKDYQDYLARLRTIGTYVDQNIELMREGMRRGIVHPKVIMNRVPEQLDRLYADDPSESLFYKPFKSLEGSSRPEDREIVAAARDAIAKQVQPAYAKFQRFFEDEYLQVCKDEVGIWQLPDGEKMYAFFAQRETTTDLTPDQIHEIGLSEVKRITAEMDAVIAQVGFKGTRAQFFEYLRTDPKFFYKTGEELLAATRALSKKIDPKLVKLFKTMPRMPYGVEPIPDAIAPDTTTAYYNPPAADGSRAGTYYVNLYKPETRPKWEMVALSLHEAVPGHHFQIARAMELGDVPAFRKYGSGFTAYVEGWGLYSEALGDEMGMYADPYDRFGKLTYEIWRAVRLVVDTGIHHKKWTRQQAIDYFKEHAPKTELDIINEVDRYIAWPGQALAYKIGELKIKELRAKAESKLGEKFDVREFHDLLLGSGALPLNLLERNVDEWISRGGR